MRRITIVDTTDAYVMHAKTGWKKVDGETDLGWYVGWVERDKRRWFFALNVDLHKDEDGAKRVPLAREILLRVGALPKG